MNKNEFEDRIKPLLPSLYRIAYFVVRNKQDAEDVVQDALIKAYTKLYTYDETKGAFKQWINSIVYFTAIDAYRKNKKYYCVEDVALSFEDTQYCGIKEMIDGLPYKSRLIIVCLANGLTNSEIAERLGITYNNAAVMVHRARKQLRKMMT